MKKWLLTVLCCLMAFSCSDDSVSLGKDVVVKAFPEHFDLGGGEPMETDFRGLLDPEDARVFDKVSSTGQYVVIKYRFL